MVEKKYGILGQTKKQEVCMAKTKKKRTAKTGGEMPVIHLNKLQLTAVVSIVLAVIFCILWVSALQKAPVAPNEVGDISDVTYTPLAGKTIVVDAGHGGGDPGMIGISGRPEKEVNLEISRKLRNLLEQRGADVLMTRQTDNWLGNSKEEDFVAREKIIAEANADLFLCIHCNAFEEQTAAGPQVFYVAEGSSGKQLAEQLQAAMNEMLEPAEPRAAIAAAYRLLKTGSQPSCTVECGFMSNPAEEALLQTPEYQQKIAEAIAKGVIRYVEEYT